MLAAQSREPANRVPVPPFAPERRESISNAGWRVLLVDDDGDAVSSLAMILELFGHDVRTAFDGESALEKAESFQPELTILDILMPGMDGYEVCRRLRTMPNGRKMVIAALTGLGQKRDRLRWRMVGFDLHVVKPIDPGLLNRLLANLMPRRD